jgi:uncharacterized protein YdaU (DUF1376 family)
MSGQAWYRHNPRDFLDGVVGMTPDTIGAYIVCLDLIYARGGPIPFDARWLSGCMGCSTRAATALVERLIRAGKLALECGNLTNIRATSELQEQAERTQKLAENGAKGGRKVGERSANENETSMKNGAYVDISTTSLKPGLSIREEKREDKKGVSNDTPREGVCEGVASEWNDMAKRTGLALVTALNKPRRAAIAARLAEHGRAKFTEAIAAVERSPFCLGESGRWKASFDFLLQPSSFLKLIEGNYDASKGNYRNGCQPSATDIAMARLAQLTADEQSGMGDSGAQGLRLLAQHSR